MNSISVFGIGKLGFPLIACLAHKGFKVIGYDINHLTVNSVNERKPTMYETGLEELIQKPSDMSASSDSDYVIKNTDITFIIVPTPSLTNGSFDTKYVESASKIIASAIKDKSSYHLISITSTVLPSNTETRIKTVLEKESGKKCGKDFGLCYNPEFIALGSVIHDIFNPDVVLIGEYDNKSGDILSEVYQKLCDNNPPIVRTTIYNAELAKISLNAFITMKISFANMLAELCEKIPGGDARAVSKILGCDTRIGSKYISGAIAYGGTCFPRDNRAFAYVASKLGNNARLAIATDKENNYQNRRIVDLVEDILGEVKDKRIAILGLTYKPETEVTEESASIKIAGYLRDKGATLSLYDPMGMRNARITLGGDSIYYAVNTIDCIKEADICIVATAWNQFKDIKPYEFTNNMKTAIILDCWRLYDKPEYKNNIQYYAIGKEMR